MPLIFGWTMPTAKAGEWAKREVVAFAMTEDGEMLLQAIITNPPKGIALNGMVFQFLDSPQAHARFSQRFPGGYEAETTTMFDVRVRLAIERNRKLGLVGGL
jgi:hypothetical protein